jgi:hypothetical protein
MGVNAGTIDAMPESRIERILDPSYAEDVRSLALEDLRAKRTECSEVEVGLSYLRRLVQGRLDIVLSDLQRRAGGESADLEELVGKLPEILGEHQRPPGLGRLPTLLAPSDADSLTAELDSVADPQLLHALPDLEEEEVRRLADSLGDLERKTSSQRRLVFERIDALQEEIVRRYKEGEATVDSLLK